MKIGLLQPDVKNGCFIENAQKLLELCAEKKADVYIAPKNAISGIIRGDIINKSAYREMASKALSVLKDNIQDKSALLCSLFPLFNEYYLITKNSAAAWKKNITYKGVHFFTEKKYDTQDTGLQLVYMNMESRPYPAVYSYKKKEAGYITASPHITGCYDGILFAGQSCILDKDGRLAARGKTFAEDTVIFDLIKGTGNVELLPQSKEEEQWLGLVTGVRDFVYKAGSCKAVLGLSGGMDSALVACIAVEALGRNNVTGILMPSPWSSAGSIEDALELAQNLGISTHIVPISSIMDAFSQSLTPVFEMYEKKEDDLTLENLQARIRGVILMAFSNRSGALVLNTGNKSEAAMGYCTLYGDTVGAVSVIGSLYKTRVYELASWYNKKSGAIPDNIFIKAPSAELRPGQKDTDSLPPYPELDAMLEILEKNKEICNSALQEIDARIRKQHFKRCQCPPVIKI